MQKLLLLILDGWGINPDSKNNAIAKANPPFWNSLLESYPNTTLHCREESVGLSKGHLSNSEVGHTAIGAGRIIEQSAFAIDKAIEKNTFEKNKSLKKIESHLNKNNSTLHLIGLLSDGGVHSHINHLIALLNWTKKNNFKKIALHLFLDGRDMAPKSAIKLFKQLEKHLGKNIEIASICGRAVGMDRSENWDRSLETYKNITNSKNIVNTSPIEHIEKNYKENITDEFIRPARFTNSIVQKNDTVFCFNFRADRMRQLVRLFLEKAPGAKQKKIVVPKNLLLTSMSNYDNSFKSVEVLFEKIVPKNNLGEWISKKGLKQLRITETEKAAHITYFINGGQDIQYENEERLIIPSLGLENYASNPEMSLDEITKSLVRALKQNHFDLIMCNIANGDMVGHSGNFEAGVKAVKFVDSALSQIIPEAKNQGYTIIITSDHGNIEYMEHDEAPHTAHTNNDVPFIITKPDVKLVKDGFLNQIAPTVLDLMEIEKPDEMTSESLIL